MTAEAELARVLELFFQMHQLFVRTSGQVDAALRQRDIWCDVARKALSEEKVSQITQSLNAEATSWLDGFESGVATREMCG